MSSSVVAVSLPRAKSLTNRKVPPDRQLAEIRTPTTKGHGSPHAATAAKASSHRLPEVTGVGSKHQRLRQSSKGAPGPSQRNARATSARSPRSPKVRLTRRGRKGTSARRSRSSRGRVASSNRHITSSSATSTARSPRSAGAASRLSREVALNRLQRAARWFLLHRYVRQFVPVASPPPERFNPMDDEDAATEAAPQFESRLVHRIRAELYREKRSVQLRARAAVRVIQRALRRWVKTRSLRDKRLSLQSRVLLACELSPRRGAEMDAALCSIQAALRMYASSRLAAMRRMQSHQGAAVHVLEEAWLRAPKYTVRTRHMNDRNMREMLCRHEAVERRDLLRLRLLFVLLSHQAFFNNPLMWDSGLPIRRIPLFAEYDIFANENPRAIADAAAAAPLEHRTVGHAGSATLGSDAAVRNNGAVSSALHTRTSPFFATATAMMDGICEGGSPIPGGPGFSEIGNGSQLVGEGKDDSRFDTDKSVRLVEFYLCFSPEERTLLNKVTLLPQLQDISPAFMCAAAERCTALDAIGPSKAEADARLLFAAPPPLVVSNRAADSVTRPLTYSEAFASALTYLQQRKDGDAFGLSSLKHLDNIRKDTLSMLQELHLHGYVSLGLVAPILTYGFHYKSMARGDADSSCFTITPGMKACRPMLVGRIACAAAELQQCFVGAVQDLRASARLLLPVVLEEHKHLIEAAALARNQLSSRRKVPLLRSSLQHTKPTAQFMREGFANAGTEALYFRPKLTHSAVISDSQGAESCKGSHQDCETGISYVAERSLRLATSADDVGPYWCEFLQSMGADAYQATSNERSKRHHQSSASSNTEVSSLISSATLRTQRPLKSHLLPHSSSYLLQDFTLSGIQKRQGNRGAIRSQNAATGVLVLANVSEKIPSSTSLVTLTAASVSPREWWNAVERLLLQEYKYRAEFLVSEEAYRRSLGVLRHLLRPSARESLVMR